MAESNEREKNRKIVFEHIVRGYIFHTERREEIDNNAFEHHVRVVSIGTNLPRDEVRAIIEEAFPTPPTPREGHHFATRHP